MSPLIRATALLTALSSAKANASPPEAVEQLELPAPSTADDPEASWVEPGRVAPPEAQAGAAPRSGGVDPGNYKLVLAGNILTGVGLGAFVMMTAGFLVASDGRDRLGFANAKAKPDEDEITNLRKRIRTGNLIGIAGAAAAGALLISGLTLIGVGRSRERKRRAGLEASRVLPLVGPGGAGLQWTAWF